DPAEAVGGDVLADLEADAVAVEGDGLVGVVDGDEHGGHGDCHAADGTAGTRARASPILLGSQRHPAAGAGSGVPGGTAAAAGPALVRRGRVTANATQHGTRAIALWSRARYSEGVTPTISVKRELNDPSEVAPTATQASVTVRP